MLTDTDYSTKNNPSVDRALYLITMVSYYISKKNRIIFIYKFVDLIRLVRPANRRKGLIPPYGDYVLSVVQTSPDKVYHHQSCRDSRLSTGANLTSSREIFSDEILRECISCQSPHLTYWSGRSQKERGVSEPISVRTMMSIINCRGDSSDRDGHMQMIIKVSNTLCYTLRTMICATPLLHKDVKFIVIFIVFILYTFVR